MAADERQPERTDRNLQQNQNDHEGARDPYCQGRDGILPIDAEGDGSDVDTDRVGSGANCPTMLLGRWSQGRPRWVGEASARNISAFGHRAVNPFA